MTQADTSIGDPAALFQQAMGEMAADRPQAARTLLEQVTELAPDHAKTRYALGVACFRSGDMAGAHAALSRVDLAALDPTVGRDALWHLALAARASDRPDEAKALSERLLADHPDFFGGPALRGDLHCEDNPAAAETDLRQALALNPAFAPARRTLAALLLRQGRIEEATTEADRLAKDGSADVALDRQLGRLLYEHGRTDAALAPMRRAADGGTDSDKARLALALLDSGQIDEAMETVDRLPAEGGGPQVAFARGLTAYRSGDFATAATALAGAAADGVPWQGDALALSGFLARLRGDSAAAWRDYETILAARETMPPRSLDEAQAGLGQMLLDRGEIEQALERLGAAARADAPLRRHLDYLVSLHYQDDTTALANARTSAQAALDREIEDLPRHRPTVRTTASERPLRLVHLGDFSRNQVQAFVRPILAAYDLRQVSPLVLHAAIDGARRPGLLAGIRQAEDLTGRSPAAIASRIAELEADAVLHVTANVHADGLIAAALLPDRPQVAWGDVFGGTGLPVVGHLIADALHLPDGIDPDGMAGQVHSVAGSCFPFAPPDDAPPLGKVPGRPLTFGSTHRLAKLNDGVLDLWAGVLSDHPDSEMLLQATSLDDSEVADAIRKRFADRGIARDRIQVVGRLNHRGMLELYRRIDMILDATPWSGGLTVLEALWMGTPVVTLTGRSMRSRHAAAHLTHVGLDDLVAETPTQFRQTAAALAADPARRGLLAVDLRDRFTRSPLVAADRLAADIAGICGQLIAT